MKNSKTVEERIKAIIIENLGSDDEKVSNSADLFDDLGADSLDAVEIVMSIEEAFKIEIPDEEAEELKTVQQVIDYVTKKEGK